MTKQEQMQELLGDVLKYEDDVYKLEQLEATIFFILVGQDKYTSDALSLVCNDLSQSAKRIKELFRKAIEASKLIKEVDDAT